MEKYLILGMNGVSKSYLLSRLLNKNECFFGSGFVTHSLNGKRKEGILTFAHLICLCLV